MFHGKGHKTAGKKLIGKNWRYDKYVNFQKSHDFRSIIYDLAVLPDYQNNGIGSELIRRCRSACESSEWLVQTDKAKHFYEKNGFKENKDSFLTIPCKLFSTAMSVVRMD